MSIRCVGAVMIRLVDCNNFYASCERVFRPDWEGRPVAVLSNYTLFGDMSRRVTATLRECTPDVEICSLDESFLWFEGFRRESLIKHCS